MNTANSGIDLIHTEDLARHYTMGQSTIHALRSVNLQIRAGEFVALMGSSGSGKSTLLHLLGCLDHPSDGSYWLEGTNVATLSRNALADLRGRRIGFIFQSFNLLPRLSAWENVALPLMYQRGFGAAKQRAQALEALEKVGLQARASHQPVEMSGGERQRVAIARALVIRPAVILADEPTGNLDSVTGAEIMGLLDILHADGATIILVTHDAAVARHASRVCTMRDGSLSEAAYVHP